MRREVMVNLSEVVVRHVKVTGQTQGDFEAAAGLRTGYISDLKQLRLLSMDVEIFFKIAYALDVSPASLARAVELNVPMVPDSPARLL